MATHAHAKCPKCGTVLQIPVQGDPEGRRIRCGSCQGVFVLRRKSSDSGAAPTTSTPRATPRPPDAIHTAPTALGQETTARASSGSASSTAPAWRFDRGDVVAGRYRILRRIARGGMGEVYEAEDHELGGAVALKTIRPEMAREAWSADRFRREIQLARQVTHPNVCRIFDVSYHEGSDPEGGEREGTAGGERVVFLTMELLRGETLTERLLRDGPLAPEVALPIARQLAAALDAAHGAGVIHRDLKCNNVMLVPPRDASGEDVDPRDLRVVITDFGLARGAGDAGLAATLALGGTTLGTPDYLAPEQVEGSEVTAAVDVYAFGLVLYETVTGKLPFSGDTVLSVAVQRVREDAPSPRTHVPELPDRWERAILGCLERDPATRFATAGKALEVLERGGSAAASQQATSPEATLEKAPERTPERTPADGSSRPSVAPREPRRSSRRQVALLLLLVVAAVAVGLYRYQSWKTEQGDRLRQALGLSPGQALIARPAVAVLGLRNLSGDPEADWLGTAIAEMLRTELRASDELRVVSGDDVARMEMELEMELELEAQPAEDLDRIRRASGADHVVTGSYTLLGERPQRQVRLDLQVQDALRGETLASVAETGAETELFDLVARVGTALRDRLGVARPDATPGLLEELRRAALPSNPEAARLYSEGLEDIRRFEPLAAQERLTRAVELEPGHPLIHSGLAVAWSALGYEDRSRQEIQKALELSEGLPQAERRSIEARYYQALGDWDRAVEIWRSLLVQYPSNLEYGVRLASSQIQSGQAQAALSTVAALRSLPPPAGEDVRLDLTEANAAAAVGNAARQRDAAMRAAAKGEEQNSRLLVAQARLAECNALLRLSRPQEARTACEESYQIFADRGDRTGQASALTVTANILYDQGDLSGARQRFEDSLEVYRSIGNQRAIATVLNNLAVVVRNQGDLDTALGMYEESLETFRHIGSPDGEAAALTNLAPLLVRKGALSEARSRLERALALRRETEDRRGEASALDQLGAVLREQGKLAEGRQKHRDALRIGREIDSRRAMVVSLGHLGEAALGEGDLDTARQRFEESLALSQEIGYRSPEASAEAGLADVAYEGGNLLAARQRHRRALDLRIEVGERGAAAESRLALARIHLDIGDAERAEELARSAAEGFATQGAVDRHAWALAVWASALQVLERTDESREALRRALERAGESVNLPARNAIYLRAARLEALDGDLEGALARLDPVAVSARDSGLFAQEIEARLIRLELLAPTREPLETEFDSDLLAADARAREHERLARAAETLGDAPGDAPDDAPAPTPREAASGAP